MGRIVLRKTRTKNEFYFEISINGSYSIKPIGLQIKNLPAVLMSDV
jgi:hypothetical protein